MTTLLCARCRGRVILDVDEFVCLLCSRRTPLRRLPPLPLLHGGGGHREPGHYRAAAGVTTGRVA